LNFWNSNNDLVRQQGATQPASPAPFFLLALKAKFVFKSST
jgi:hypothetical protein